LIEPDTRTGIAEFNCQRQCGTEALLIWQLGVFRQLFNAAQKWHLHNYNCALLYRWVRTGIL